MMTWTPHDHLWLHRGTGRAAGRGRERSPGAIATPCSSVNRRTIDAVDDHQQLVVDPLFGVPAAAALRTLLGYAVAIGPFPQHTPAFARR